MNVQQIVTDKIIESLKNNVIPWKKPWVCRNPQNIRGTEYRGINYLLLSLSNYANPYWGTFNQISKEGGTITTGEKASLVTYWAMLDSKDDEDTKIPFLRYYNIFNILQTTGMDKYLITTEIKEDILEAETIIKNMTSVPVFENSLNLAAYYPTRDVITMPDKSIFNAAEEYYFTLFHELIHSTAHASRLNRKFVEDDMKKNSYAFEELVAEIGANFLMAKIGKQTPSVFDNSVGYIQNWLKKFQEHPKFILKASSFAQKAVDFILNVKKEELETLQNPPLQTSGVK